MKEKFLVKKVKELILFRVFLSTVLDFSFTERIAPKIKF